MGAAEESPERPRAVAPVRRGATLRRMEAGGRDRSAVLPTLSLASVPGRSVAPTFHTGAPTANPGSGRMP
jgi:hypothetical protein